ncbi:MAG: UDP-N-acetylmuramoyl-tripeptide--D-alanyl-D-alanine ligase, partial [Planctomycetes bacterium]|nr:UDP-N-acetylmuramoyl-tripeptide--D-alanyl-D-alanine ligase [Planctomycetota bacterium]
MKPIDIQTLSSILNAATEQGEQSGSITGVSIDSRATGAGDCFFAIKGPNFDGHNFVADALAAGAVCAVVGADFDQDCGKDAILLKVDDTVTALGVLARWYRRAMGFKVVAITGSAGKTTTREIVYHVLKTRFRCIRAMKSFNNDIGLPLTLFAADEGCQIVIAELGSNRIGEMGHLTAIAQPDIAVVTNIYPAHLEGFGSIEAITKEKASIAEGLKAEGKLLICGDFPDLADRCDALGREFTTFGRGPNCDIRATDPVSTGPEGTLTIDDTVVSVPLPGGGNLDNTLAAWAVCREFGVPIADFASAVKT